MSFQNGFKELLKHPLFTAIAGGVAGAIAGSFVTYNVTIHDAVTYNNISSYIDSMMVKPGLVDEEILSLETPFEQIEEIATTMNEKESDYNTSLDEISSNKEELETDLNETKTELEELKKQKLAKLSSPELNILGENKDTTLKDYMATIDGHAYYSEGFLNTFLPDEISYNEDIIKYGKDVPEKVNVASEGLVYDLSRFEVYNGTHFTMGHHEYTSGIVTKDDGSGGSFNIDCNGEYSRISFIPGHIDDSGSFKRTLTISYLGDDGIFKEIKTIEMNIEMPMNQIILPIYNTKTVRVTSTGSANTQYGLADVYLIK